MRLSDSEASKLNIIEPEAYQRGSAIYVEERFYRVIDGFGNSTYGPILRVVLSVGAVGDYAAYAGFGEAKDVAKWGEKLSFAEAKLYFEWIQEAKYRK